MKGRDYVSFAAVIVMIASMTSGSVAGLEILTADFEGYPEGGRTAPFLDAQSGILFTNGNRSFAIEYASTSDLPMFMNNKYFGSGVAPGSGWSLPFQFNFSGILPTPANSIEMDVVSGSIGTISFPQQGVVTLLALNSAGGTVGQATFPVSGPLFFQSHLSIHSPNFDIASFTITAVNAFDVFDNISYTIPEPGTAAALGLSSIIAVAGRRRSRACVATHH